MIDIDWVNLRALGFDILKLIYYLFIDTVQLAGSLFIVGSLLCYWQDKFVKVYKEKGEQK